MKIAVLLKRVPDTGISLRVNPDGSDILQEGVAYVTNPYDEYGLEEAVRIKERSPEAEVVAISLGPDEAQDVLRNALAIGADRAILLKSPDYRWLDPLSSASILAEALKAESPDLILVGKQAVDDNAYAVPAYIAHSLGLPIVSYAIRIDLSGSEALVTRETDWGTEKVKVSLPCVITCEKGLNEPRLPALRGIMAAKKKPIDVKDVSGSPVFGRPSLALPPQKQAGVKVQKEFPQDVDDLVSFLREKIL
ncbi:MAG: electron transfer flavoprotein subunit beta/FixA family protein [candidate division WOR-3 bacterium]